MQPYLHVTIALMSDEVLKVYFMLVLVPLGLGLDEIFFYLLWIMLVLDLIYCYATHIL